MTPESAAIRTRSEQQALDWSLVLVSQGIDHAIAPATADGSWELQVAPAEEQRARATLGIYLRENRRQRWRREFATPNLLFDLRVVPWCGLLALIHLLNESTAVNFHNPGIMDTRAVRTGEWWRLVTATTLHADLAHLAANAVSGLLLLGIAMGFFGAGVALLGVTFAGVMGNLAGLAFRAEDYRGLGASGAVMGALGLLATHAVRGQPLGHGTHWLIRGLMGGVLLLVLLGFDPKADVLAHVGGFVGGAAFGWVWGRLPPGARVTRMLDRLAGPLTAALFAVTWFLALRRAQGQ